jgi:hypothetical protein
MAACVAIHFSLPLAIAQEELSALAIANPMPETGDGFGISVAAVGTDRVLIGAHLGDVGAVNAGIAAGRGIGGRSESAGSAPPPRKSADEVGAKTPPRRTEGHEAKILTFVASWWSSNFLSKPIHAAHESKMRPGQPCHGQDSSNAFRKSSRLISHWRKRRARNPQPPLGPLQGRRHNRPDAFR